MREVETAKDFFDRKEHQQKVLALLEKASTLLKRFSEDLSSFSRTFTEYWTQELGGKTFAAYARENMNIILTFAHTAQTMSKNLSIMCHRS